MPTYSRFQIINIDLLKKSLTIGSNKNIGGIIQGNIEEFGAYFKAESLPISGTKNYFNQILNNEDSFTEPIYNAFLCCLFDGYKTGDKTTDLTHSKEDFIDFYNSIEVPTDRLNNKQRNKYNSILRKIILERPYFKEYNFQMDSHWSIISSKNKNNQPNSSNNNTKPNNLNVNLENNINISIENNNTIESRQRIDKKSIKKNFIQKRYILIIFTFILFILFGIGYFIINSNDNKKEVVQNKNCIFPDSEKYKILIIPFENRLNTDGVEKDIGLEIEERLDRLNKDDSLNIDVHYCYDFIFNKTVNDKDDADYFRRVMNESNVDHIIYGTLQDTEYIDLTSVRINYISKPKTELQNNIEFDTNIQFNEINLNEISYGVLLGNIEYLIYLNTAISFINNKNYEKANYYLDEISDEGIDKPDWLEMKVIVLTNQRKYDDALPFIDRLLSIDLPSKHLANALFIKGYIKFLEHDDIAMEYFDKSIELSPNISFAHFIKAMHLWHERGDFENSIKSLDKAIELENDAFNKTYLFNTKSEIYFRNQYHIEAINSVNNAIGIANNIKKIDMSSLYFNKALSLYHLKRYDESLNVLDKVLAQNNSDRKKANVFIKVVDSRSASTNVLA